MYKENDAILGAPCTVQITLPCMIILWLAAHLHAWCFLLPFTNLSSHCY